MKYTLTHSTRHFAAAIVSDGFDAGYFQYLVFYPSFPVGTTQKGPVMSRLKPRPTRLQSFSANCRSCSPDEIRVFTQNVRLWDIMWRPFGGSTLYDGSTSVHVKA
jgi:hypothetical protein